MKNQFVTVTALLLILSALYTAGFAKTGWEEDSLKGPVSEMKNSHYSFFEVSNSLRKELMSEDITRYNRDGMRTESYHITFYGGTVTNLTEYRYDGTWLVHVSVQEPMGSVKETQEYYYNSSGLLTSLVQKDAGGVIIFSNTFIYNTSGLLITQYDFHVLSEEITSMRFEYDAAGRKTKRVYLKADGSVSAMSRLTYDESGNLIEDAFYSGTELTRRTVMKYDGQGRVVEEFYYGQKDVLEQRFTLHYDDRGDRTMTVYYSPGSTNGSKIMESYDTRHNLLETLVYDTIGKCTEKQSRIRDGKGNVISDIHYRPLADGLFEEIWRVESSYWYYR